MIRTIKEINDKISRGQVVVVTAEEVRTDLHLSGRQLRIVRTIEDERPTIAQLVQRGAVDIADQRTGVVDVLENAGSAGDENQFLGIEFSGDGGGNCGNGGNAEMAERAARATRTWMTWVEKIRKIRRKRARARRSAYVLPRNKMRQRPGLLL